MAICNLFKELANANGTFLTFSQYLEDITKQQTLAENHRVVPSKFIALDIDVNANSLDSETIAQYLQNNFENACACWRDSKGASWKPEYSKYLFWEAFLTKFTSKDSNSVITAAKYAGDINIFSHDNKNGMGYSEIYCYIPNEATLKDVKIEIEGNRQVLTSSSVGSYIKGYSDDELVSAGLPTGWGSIPANTTYPLQKHNIAITNHSGQMPSEFKANTIIILYDIYNASNTKVEYDIPLGIYFTGIVTEDNNGVKSIGNEIIKYISNDTIYGSGTSYGLRICTRYVSSIESTTVHEIEINSDNNAELTQVLSQVSISQKKMDDILDKVYSDNQNYKDLLAIFKNSRTNVPYIKNVDGVNYWFVNGKILNKAVADGHDCECLDLQASIADNIILLTDTAASYTRYIDWKLIAGDLEVVPHELYVNNVQQRISTPISITEPKRTTPTTIVYDIKAKVDNREVIEKTHISFVWPSYWGLVNSVPTSINGLNPLSIEYRSFDLNYDNIESKHICFAYPKSYGMLTSIKDSRDIEYINDFTVTTKTFNGVEYNVYMDIHPANVVNYTLKFR